MDTDMGTAMVMDTAKNRQSSRKLSYTPRGICRAGVLFPLSFFCLLVSAELRAEREWRIEPTLTLRAEGHSRTGADASDGWLAEISPSLAVRYRVAETNVSLNYSPRLIFTDLNDQRSSVVHALLGQASTQFASGRVRIGSNVSIGEQSIDPLSTNSISSVPDPNRARFYNFGVNGSVRENLAPGLFGEVRAEYTYSSASAVSASSTNLANNASTRWRVSGDIKPTSRNPEFGWIAGGNTAHAMTILRVG